ncbi:MAG: DUF202 domain-containing protein [Candidatus Saccharibacteria bacterium]
MEHKNIHKPTEQVLLNEIELLLAEKRTYYSVLRTGFAIITVPLTVIIFLLATKDYHRLFTHKWSAILVVVTFIVIVIIGIFVCIIGSNKIKKVDKAILRVEKEDKRVENIII